MKLKYLEILNIWETGIVHSWDEILYLSLNKFMQI